MGTKDLDGPTHQRLLQKLPLKTNPVQAALGLDRDSPNGGSVVEARMDGDEEEFWKFFSTGNDCDMVAFLTCVMWNALRQIRFKNGNECQLSAYMVDRGTSELNPVIPTCVSLCHQRVA